MLGMLCCRDTVHTAMIDVILSVTPPDCFDVEICDVTEGPAGHKVFLYKAHQPFHAAFCKRMPWLAQFRGEANRIHEGFIVFIPYRMATCVAPVCDTLHVVSQDGLRDVVFLVRLINPVILVIDVDDPFDRPLINLTLDLGYFDLEIVVHLDRLTLIGS